MKLILIILLGAVMMSCSQFGSRPSDTEKEEYFNSSQFNQKKMTFQNRQQNVIDEMRKNSMSWKTIKEWFGAGKDRVPKDLLPEIKPDMKEFLKASNEIKIVWFGHSSFLLNLDGKIVLVDPVFSGAASPVSFMVKRFQAPVLKLEELPEIDYILISHDHYDHLDMESIKFFVSKNVKFVTPLGVGSHLQSWGIEKNRITEKDWWQSAQFDGIKFIATPAQHFSGRDGIHQNDTLWASWVIQSEKHNIYFSGDSGYDTHFKEIGEKFGPFDIAFIESGQYNEKWKEVHMMPEEAIIAFKELKAKKYFPVHWGMFELAMHSWYEPIERVYNLAQKNNVDLIAPKIGQIVEPNQSYRFEKWWLTVQVTLPDGGIDEAVVSL
ncbi:MBL fold metallo-hydrolase [Bacteriovoracaceae bacterium]|nr:MBL fold metallo-hydrolase [Bacteriovoracaceae bacterium]